MVLPGDKIGVEEEFVASDNTYVDKDGTIRAAIIGNVHIVEGKISVHDPKHDIKKVRKGMFVLGRVTDDLGSVAFVKIDNMRANGTEFMALKDGRIVASMEGPRRGPPGRDFGGRGGGRGGGYGGREERKPRLYSVGDVILAKIVSEDPETFLLGLRDPETGVVHAECELCDSEMHVLNPGLLECNKCKHKEQRKISVFYDKPEEIKRLFLSY